MGSVKLTANKVGSTPISELSRLGLVGCPSNDLCRQQGNSYRAKYYRKYPLAWARDTLIPMLNERIDMDRCRKICHELNYEAAEVGDLRRILDEEPNNREVYLRLVLVSLRLARDIRKMLKD